MSKPSADGMLRATLMVSMVLALLAFTMMAVCVARYVSFLTQTEPPQEEFFYPHPQSHEEAGWRMFQT